MVQPWFSQRLRHRIDDAGFRGRLQLSILARARSRHDVLQDIRDVGSILQIMLWYGGRPHTDFNTSRLAMPPKGDDLDDTPVALISSPEKVRPLNLSNTDSKRVFGMIASPLEEMASHIVASFQKG